MPLPKRVAERIQSSLRQFQQILDAQKARDVSEADTVTLVKDMLSFSKEREPCIKDLDVNALVREVAELMKPRAQARNIRLELRLAADLPICQADREGIHRALHDDMQADRQRFDLMVVLLVEEDIRKSRSQKKGYVLRL